MKQAKKESELIWGLGNNSNKIIKKMLISLKFYYLNELFNWTKTISYLAQK